MDKAIFSAQMDQLAPMLGWIQERWTHEPKSFCKIEVALEEALVNIIQHAYKKNGGKIELTLKIDPKSHIEIGIRDWGSSFNPLLEGPKVDPTASLEERREGGLGIFLISKLLDDVLYEWDGSSNLLILIKRFSQKP